MRPNQRTPEGADLGRHIARLCDKELAGKPDKRCPTCAFRAGEHLANGSVETLMSAIKCCSERTTYSSWKCMIRRCTKPADQNWDDYGGRGITVCECWLKFENFGFPDFAVEPFRGT